VEERRSSKLASTLMLLLLDCAGQLLGDQSYIEACRLATGTVLHCLSSAFEIRAGPNLRSGGNPSLVSL
jgi:hypothetical protein